MTAFAHAGLAAAAATTASTTVAWFTLAGALGGVLPPGAVVNRHLTHPVTGLADGAGLARQVQKLARKAWEAELGWRAAADALLLIAGPAVVSAAAVHIGVTEQKIAAAWQGRDHPDENGVAYRG